MDDTAAFKFDSLPGVTFVVTRFTAAKTTPDGNYPEGWLEIVPHRDGSSENLGASGQGGPTAPPSMDKPYVPGGKVPFVFRSLPGHTFYAQRAVRDVEFTDSSGQLTRWEEGWIRLSYSLDGRDEEHELGGYAGPRAEFI